MMEKRLETIIALELPYRETLKIQRCVYRGGSGPRVAVTSGIHGDELEGLYVCHRLTVWLEELSRMRPDALLGQVEIYPGLNPLGLDTLERNVPVYQNDLNRYFPGHPDGLLPQRIAAAAMNHLQGAVLVLDVHASNIYLREIPQVRVDRRFSDVLLPLASMLNMDLIWLRSPAQAPDTSLAYNLNQRGEPCLLVEMGAGMGLTPAFTEQLLTGVLAAWRRLGVLAPDLDLPEPGPHAILAADDNIYYLNAETSGLFVPAVANGALLAAGQPVGHIVSPVEAAPLAEVCAPVNGVLFTLREYPLVYEGSLLGRIVATPTAK